MTGIQVPVDANLNALNKKLDGLAQKIDQINRKKWDPIDPAGIERSTKKVEQTILDSQRRIEKGDPVAAGTAGRGRRGGNMASDEVRYGIRKRYTTQPEFSDIPRSFLSGFGGGFSQIAGAGTRGAMSGLASGGGVMGLLGGLAKGTAIGALAYGAFKAAGAVSDGVDMAGDRAATLDQLKRQLGDVGVSFEKLKAATDNVAYGLGINSKEFAIIEQRLNIASRGADRTALELADSAGVSSGFARAYGMDPGATASMFGSARNVDQRENYRQLASILADTIEKSGMASRADEVVQAVLSFGATASRLSLSAPNYGAYAGAYSGLMSSGIAGMTPEAASALLSQANSAMSNMGAAGEAGQAFTFAALQHSGRGMNPLEAMAESSGGLFGSRSSVFGPNSQMRQLLGDKASDRLSGGPHADDTNFDMIRAQAARIAGNGTIGKELQAEMLQRYFGLQSMEQAAALMNLKPGAMNGLDATLKGAGVDMKQVNPENIQTVAKLANTRDMDGLDAIYSDLRKRTGSSALTDDDRKSIEAARGQGEGEFRNALVRASSGKDYAQDQYTVARDSKAYLETIQTMIGQDLIPAINFFKDDMVTLLGGKKKLADGKEAERLQTAKETYDANKNEETRRYEAEKQRNTGWEHMGEPGALQRLKANEERHRKAEEQNNREFEQATRPGGAPGKTAMNGVTGGGDMHLTAYLNVTTGADGKATVKKTFTAPRGSGTWA